MKLFEVKKHFAKALSSEYPSDEIHSFYLLLSEFILKLSRVQTTLQRDRELSEKEISLFKKAIQELKVFKPIQYIIGETEFYGLTFFVNKEVLIPRPETEELVEWIVADFSEIKSPSILDIGTGSGCIAISLAHKIEHAAVEAIDVSEEVLKIAKKNALYNKVAIKFIQQNILKLKELDRSYDIIVSNPPYVRELEKKQMEPNVLKYEPALALYVKDTDSLIFYKKIAQLAYNQLNVGGALYFEINAYLSKELKNMLHEIGFKTVEVRTDMFGKDRMIKCVRC